jgi:hypothetical protein
MENKFQRGDVVKVTHRLTGTQTEKYHTIAYEMRDMQGNIYRIDEVEASTRIRIQHPTCGRSFVFHPDDLLLTSSFEITPKLFNFDPATLNL